MGLIKKICPAAAGCGCCGRRIHSETRRTQWNETAAAGEYTVKREWRAREGAPLAFSETWPAGYCRAVVCQAGLCWPGYPGWGVRNEKDASSLLCARSTTAGGILEGRQERKRCTLFALHPLHDSVWYPGGVPGTKKMHPVCFAPGPRQRAVSWRSARNEKDTLNKIMLDSTLKFPHVEGVFLRFPCACQVIPEKISVAVI